MIDPFVLPPFSLCPKCGENTFGILSIHGDVCCRRCASCRYPGRDSYSGCLYLPPVKKKILYLDQHVVCNFAFLNTSDKKVSPFYERLYSCVKDLYIKQAVVCPESQAHEEESSFHSSFQTFRDYYRRFSCGVRFESFSAIEEMQFRRVVNSVVGGYDDSDCSGMHYNPVSGDVNCWIDRMQVNINRNMLEDWVVSWMKSKEEIEESFVSFFLRFRECESDPFDAQYRLELESCGKELIRQFVGYLEKMEKLAEGGVDEEYDPFWMINQPLGFIVIKMLRDIGGEYGYSYEYVLRHFLIRLFSIEMLEKVPYVNISALLFSGLARCYYRDKAMKPATKGDSYDIRVISHLLPYCDAMVVDKKFGILLDELKKNGVLKYKTKVFYKGKDEEMFRYFDEICAEIPAEQLDMVSRVYSV